MGIPEVQTPSTEEKAYNVEKSYDVENDFVGKDGNITEVLQRRAGMSAEDVEFLANFPMERRKAVIRKVDWRLIPMLLTLYLVTYLDKANIGNAKIEGLQKSLHMDGAQYNVALAVFFVPYVIFEVPSNMFLNKFKRPSYYLGLLTLLWGIVMTCTGTVTNYSGLVALRFLLGLFEAGFFPGAILLISKWYLPNETQTRIAFLYSSAATGGAISGILAYGIAKMDGVAGYEAWRWIFIIEGLATVFMAFLCFFLLIDSPALSSRWLAPDEIRWLELRQMTRRVVNKDEYRKKGPDWTGLWEVVKDWKIILLIFANWSQTVPNYALKFTMPQIIKNMGYTSADAQLLTIPPYIIGAISSLIFSVIGDRTTWRMPTVVIPELALIPAYAILFAKSAQIKDNIALCYFAVCLSCFGLYPIFPGVNAWAIANLAPASKRAIGIGYLVGWGNVGGLVGSFIYKDSEAPKYPTGFGNSLAWASAGIVASLILEYALWNLNKRNAKVNEKEVREKYTEDELERMGDRSPLFRYAL